MEKTVERERIRRVTETEPTKIRQGYGLTRIYEVEIAREDAAPATYAVRVDIERNAYDFQSHYETEVLTPAAGWKPLHRVAPETAEMSELPVYVAWDSRRGECVEAVERVAATLVAESARILALLP